MFINTVYRSISMQQQGALAGQVSGTFGPHLEQKMLMKRQLQRGNESSGLSGQIRHTSPGPAKLSEVAFPTYLVKTPAAKPKVVSLALSRTSASVSNGKMDITGPKISSFTQVMSSLQLAANIVTEPDISDGLPCLALENAFSAVTMKHTTLRTSENPAQNTSCSPAARSANDFSRIYKDDKSASRGGRPWCTKYKKHSGHLYVTLYFGDTCTLLKI